MNDVHEVVLPAAAPLGGLPAALEAKVVARIRAGYPPQSADHPRRAGWRKVVVPGAVLAGVDAVAAVVAFATGHGVLGAIAVALFVLLVLITGRAARLVRTDPLRLDEAEREAVSLACGWRSTGPAGAGVAAGAAAVARVVASPAWWSPLLDGHRTSLDLRRWLDALGDDPGPAETMTGYATELEGMVTRHGAGKAVDAVPVEADRLHAVLTGSDRLSP